MIVSVIQKDDLIWIEESVLDLKVSTDGVLLIHRIHNDENLPLVGREFYQRFRKEDWKSFTVSKDDEK